MVGGSWTRPSDEKWQNGAIEWQRPDTGLPPSFMFPPSKPMVHLVS